MLFYLTRGDALHARMYAFVTSVGDYRLCAGADNTHQQAALVGSTVHRCKKSTAFDGVKCWEHPLWLPSVDF